MEERNKRLRPAERNLHRPRIPPESVALRLHTGGRLRRWIGRRFGGGLELGDRIYRRCVHAIGAAVLLYYVLPSHLVAWFTPTELLLVGLGLVLLLEAMRWTVGVELPMIRPYEQARIASYTFYAAALVVAVLLFPLPIALVVVLGTALVDPLIGELRSSHRWGRAYPWLPGAAYLLLGTGALVLWTHWPVLPAVVFAGVAAVIALAVERPKIPEVDDDLAMTLVPALGLVALLIVAPGFFP